MRGVKAKQQRQAVQQAPQLPTMEQAQQELQRLTMLEQQIHDQRMQLIGVVNILAAMGDKTGGRGADNRPRTADAGGPGEVPSVPSGGERAAEAGGPEGPDN